ncbi:hypothetical protein BX666DRAFT_1312891 [Dichotomocladium elegans]|nr:hypothetical protein BX666DRAFT_1312891 [Dichotomocladium elegans]
MTHGPMGGRKFVGYADRLEVIKVAAKDGKTGEDIQLHYSNYKVAGNGSFGVVYHAKLLRTGEEIAIKKVLQDRRFKVHINMKRTRKRIGHLHTM